MNLEGLAPFGFNPIQPDSALYDLPIQLDSTAPAILQTNIDCHTRGYDEISICHVETATALDPYEQEPVESPSENVMDEPFVHEVTVNELTVNEAIQESIILSLKQELEKQNHAYRELKQTCEILQEQLLNFSGFRFRNPRIKQLDSDDPVQTWKVEWRSGFTVPLEDIPIRNSRHPTRNLFQILFDKLRKIFHSKPDRSKLINRFPTLSYIRSGS